MSLPGLLLGLIFGKWGLYISIFFFVLYTIFGLFIFRRPPQSYADESLHFRLSKAWTYSLFCVLGAALGMLLRDSL